MSNRLSYYLLVTAFIAGHAHADSIAVPVDAPFEPVSAVGLIINESATLQKTEATFTRAKDNKLVVSFPFRDSEVGDGATATALVIAEDGTMAFGEMKPIASAEQRMSLTDIPDCPAEKIRSAGLESQMGLLQKLLDVRSARRANVQQQIKEILTPEFRTKLAKLEQGFGLSRSSALTLDLPPNELQDRLIRIIAALNDYRGAKKRADEAQNVAAAAAASEAPQESAIPAEAAPDDAAAPTEQAASGMSDEALAGN